YTGIYSRKYLSSGITLLHNINITFLKAVPGKRDNIFARINITTHHRHTPVMLQKNKIIIRSQKPRLRSSPHLDIVRKLSAGQIFKHNVGSADVRITVSP